MAKVVTNPSNIELVTALCKEHPTSSYAKMLNYDANKNELGIKDLSLFTSQPDIANEFISDMANKVVVQRAYDLFRDYEMPFDVFMRTMGKLGDAEELLSASLAQVNDYGDDDDPFGASKPDIIIGWIKTEDKKEVDVKLSYEIWAGAFVSEGSLSNLAGIILKNLRDAIVIYLYEKIKTEFSSSTNFLKEEVIQEISDAGETANSQKAYEQIIALVNKMTLPSTAYNNLGEKTFTPKGRAVLVLNAKYRSAFDVNVLASLFNSGAIAEKKYFSKVITAELEDANQVGIVLDEEAYLWGYRFVVTDSIRNPRTLEINTFYHAWVKRAVVPFRNAVRLVTQASE